jgi:hypothetical protein
MSHPVRQALTLFFFFFREMLFSPPLEKLKTSDSPPERSEESGKREIFHGGVCNDFESWNFFENVYFMRPLFFLKSCFFLRNEIDSPSSNFTGKTMQCISID